MFTKPLYHNPRLALSSSIRVLQVMVLATFVGCSSHPTHEWELTTPPQAIDIEFAMTDSSDHSHLKKVDEHHWPKLYIPDDLRPCCVFGTGFKVEVKGIPVPIYSIDNIVDVNKLGKHTYNGGFLGGSAGDYIVGDSEENGMVYTCRGGVIDIAHVRDNADFTLFVFFAILPYLHEGVTVTMFPELGTRQIKIAPVPLSTDDEDYVDLAIAITGWAVYNLSILHEINQWYGLESVKGYPEGASAFSPEDLYSNIIGIRIGEAIIRNRLAADNEFYSHNVSLWIEGVLDWLGAVPRKSTKAYLKAVDQNWWDSSIRIPGKYVVRLRNYDLANRQTPKLITPLLTEEQRKDPLLEACPMDSQPQALFIDEDAQGYDLGKIVTVTEDVSSEEYLKNFPTQHKDWPKDNIITQEQFELIVTNSQQVDMLFLEENKIVPRVAPPFVHPGTDSP